MIINIKNETLIENIASSVQNIFIPPSESNQRLDNTSTINISKIEQQKFEIDSQTLMDSNMKEKISKNMTQHSIQSLENLTNIPLVNPTPKTSINPQPNSNEGFDGYDNFLTSLLPEKHAQIDAPMPHFTEIKNSNKADNSMKSQSLFSNSVQNDLFSSINSEIQNKESLKSYNNENSQIFEKEAIEINQKLDNLTKILEGLITEKKEDENQMRLNNNGIDEKNATNTNEEHNNEITLEDFDSRLEKLKKSIEGDNGKLGDNFRLIELNNDFYDPMDDAGINLNINDNENYQLNDNYYM